jgi:methyl-accepting chemotaxis protein
MRRGAITTTRAIEEQTKGTDQVAREAQNLSRQVASVSKAMDEQAKAAAEVATSARNMRRQSDQVSKGMSEQARAAREITTAIASLAREVSAITRSNRQHLESSGRVLNGIKEIQQVATENAANSKLLTSDSSGLSDRARRLAELMDSMEAGNRANGSVTPISRKRTKKISKAEGA